MLVSTSWTDFTAPCPRGHGGARWRSSLQDVVGAGQDFIGNQVPTHRVECDHCDADRTDRPSEGALGEDA